MVSWHIQCASVHPITPRTSHSQQASSTQKGENAELIINFHLHRAQSYRTVPGMGKGAPSPWGGPGRCPLRSSPHRPPQNKCFCQAGFWKQSALMMIDSSRSSSAKPHPRDLTLLTGPPRGFPSDWHKANATLTRGQLDFGCSLHPPALPAILTPQWGRGLCSNEDKLHQSTSKFNWPFFSGREKSCSS